MINQRFLEIINSYSDIQQFLVFLHQDYLERIYKGDISLLCTDYIEEFVKRFSNFPLLKTEIVTVWSDDTVRNLSEIQMYKGVIDLYSLLPTSLHEIFYKIVKRHGVKNSNPKLHGLSIYCPYIFPPYDSRGIWRTLHSDTYLSIGKN